MRKLLFLLLAVTLCFTGAASAQSWNMIDDFTPYTGGPNPNGDWRYGWLDENGAFQLFTEFVSDVYEGNTYGGWRYTGNWDYWGNVWKTYGPDPIENWASYREPGKMACGPGNEGETTIRWTCPESNDYTVIVRFTGQSLSGAGTTVGCHVRLNGGELYSGYLAGFVGRAVNNYQDGYGDPNELNWTGIISLTTNDFLDFSWDDGGTLVSDCTGIEVNIELGGDLPELPEPNLILHLQADAGVLKPDDNPAGLGDVVGTWIDQSYYGNDFTRNWGTPTLQTGSFAAPAGDKPVIRFVSADGTSGDGFFRDPNEFDPNGFIPSKFTLFIVGKANSSQQRSRTFFANYSVSGGGLITGISQSQIFPDLMSFYTNIGGEQTGNEECLLDTGKYYLITCVRDLMAGGKKLYINGNLEAAGGGSVTYDGEAVASVGVLDVGRRFLDGDIAEIMMFDGWEPNLVLQTQTNLMDKYAIDPMPCISDPNRLVITAMTYYGTTDDGTLRTEERYNTLWMDDAWDVALYDSAIPTINPSTDLLNYLPGMNIYAPINLTDGPREFSFVAARPVGGMATDRYAGLTLFFDDGTDAGISVFAQVDQNLTGIPPDPIFYANSADVTMGMPMTNIPGAGTLRYVDRDKSRVVELSDFAVYMEDVYSLDYLRSQTIPEDANWVHPIEDGGGPDGILDIVGRFTLTVKPATCQDFGVYFNTDYNKDCITNFEDFVIMLNDWLKCNDPLDPTCVESSYLQAHWKLDEAAGSVAVDSAGGNDGTLNNFPGDNSQWVPGRIDGALEFAGDNDYVEATGYKGITGAEPRTVAAWINTPAAGTGGTIISWGEADTGKKWIPVIHSSGVLRVGIWGGWINGSQDLRDDDWHHVAVVLEDGDNDVSDLKLYVDGQPETGVTSSPQTINTSALDNVSIGAYYNGSSSYAGFFTGKIDNIRIYDRGLSITEVQQLYQDGTGGN